MGSEQIHPSKDFLRIPSQSVNTQHTPNTLPPTPKTPPKHTRNISTTHPMHMQSTSNHTQKHTHKHTHTHTRRQPELQFLSHFALRAFEHPSAPWHGILCRGCGSWTLPGAWTSASVHWDLTALRNIPRRPRPPRPPRKNTWPWVKSPYPVNIPIPTKTTPKWVVHLPQNGTLVPPGAMSTFLAHEVLAASVKGLQLAPGGQAQASCGGLLSGVINTLNWASSRGFVWLWLKNPEFQNGLPWQVETWVPKSAVCPSDRVILRTTAIL